MYFYKAPSRKRRLKLAMAAGVSRNDANKVLWMEKCINQCFERHNREERLKEEMQHGN
jgi:hypothetical protein|nr:MAG TPA: hypothetical protein [Caudoviricetes sp.]